VIARLLISASIKTRIKEIEKILATHFSGGNLSHPDLLYIKAGEKLGIAEARKIKEHFSLKPYSAKGRGVVLEDAGVLTVEAQNALLKTLEELPEDARLILGADSDANLLPTILSRCEIVILGNEVIPESGFWTSQNDKIVKDLEDLLTSSTEERFEYIEKLKNKEEFLETLLQYFHQDVIRHKDFLVKLLQAKEWAKHNVNIRSILEYLMLVMPQKI